MTCGALPAAVAAPMMGGVSALREFLGAGATAQVANALTAMLLANPQIGLVFEVVELAFWVESVAFSSAAFFSRMASRPDYQHSGLPAGPTCPSEAGNQV